MTTFNSITVLKEQIKKGNVIPFIGAGISKDAKFEDGTYPPSDYELLQMLFDKIPKHAKGKSRMDLSLDSYTRSEISNFLSEYFKEDLGVMVRRLLSYIKVSPSQHQRIIGLLRFKLLMTTNYDTIIEDTIYPRPEPFITHNKFSLRYVLDEIDNPQKTAPILIKLNGCKTQPESIALGKGLEYFKEYWTTPFENIYNWNPDISLLFIGYSLNDLDFVKFMQNFQSQYKNKFQHYAIVTIQEYKVLKSRTEIDQLGIKLIPYDETPDSKDNIEFSGLWQILSQLKTDSELDLSNGIESGVFFSKDQRSSYLRAQNALEKKSTCLRYLTPSPTNAISPSEFIKNFCRGGLTNLYNSFSEDLFKPSIDEQSWVDGVIEEMLSRRKTIRDLMESGAELRVICFEEQVINDRNKNDELINNKYKYIINTIDNSSFDLEIRLIEKKDIFDSKRDSFAIMSSPYSKGTDVSIAYATQADKGEVVLHVIERNTNFTHEHLIYFESLWARAMSENKTRNYLAKLFDE